MDCAAEGGLGVLTMLPYCQYQAALKAHSSLHETPPLSSFISYLRLDYSIFFKCITHVTLQRHPLITSYNLFVLGKIRIIERPLSPATNM